jgi:hypothetical protein
LLHAWPQNQDPGGLGLIWRAANLYRHTSEHGSGVEGQDGSEWRGVLNGREYGILRAGNMFVAFEVGREWFSTLCPSLSDAVGETIVHVTSTVRE